PSPAARADGSELPRARADGVDAVSAQNAAAPEQATILPVGQAELRAAQRELTVDPARVAVAHKRGVDRLEEALLLDRVGADQRGHELGAVLVEELHRVLEAVDQLERDLGGLLPLPLAAELALAERLRLVFV